MTLNCEEDLCQNFQSAICLHCMAHLCIPHVEEHQKVLLGEVDELKDQVNQTSIAITNASNMIVKKREADEKRWNKWRQLQIGKIEREYKHMINSIKTRQQTLEQFESELKQRLQVQIHQPLENLSTQSYINPHLINDIRLAIENVRKDIDLFSWNSKRLINVKNEDGKENNSSTLSKDKPLKPKKLEKWKPRNLLCPLFRDVGFTGVERIHLFIQRKMKDENSMENYGLITLVFSYLLTWHQIKADRGRYKKLILTRHLSTVKEYIHGGDCQRKVLIALEFFFYRLKQKESAEIEMMTMLLQLFFDHQWISLSEITDWYHNDTFLDQFTGEKVEKKWAQPFLQLHQCQITSIDPPSNETTNITSISPETSSENTANHFRRNVRIRRPFKKLVQLFKDQSNRNDTAIHQYIKMQYEGNINHRVIMLIRPYFKAWNECAVDKQDDLLLNHLPVIEYYKSDPDFQMQILFAIEIFLSENTKKKNWSIPTISTLFQLFFDRNLIEKETFLKWNVDGHFYNQIYYQQTKQFAQPFLQQLLASN